MKVLLLLFLELLFPIRQKTDIMPMLTATPTKAMVEVPTYEFKQRITKKFFGTYVTPLNSPIKPERFSGYHTGVDAEYGDVTDKVEVRSISDGDIILSRFVSGYGGLIAVRTVIDGNKYVAIYGHLAPNSLKNRGKVQKGEIIGILGNGYTTETDGERKHLHFGLVKGDKVDLRGYVQDKKELSKWQDPLELLSIITFS